MHTIENVFWFRLHFLHTNSISPHTLTHTRTHMCDCMWMRPRLLLLMPVAAAASSHMHKAQAAISNSWLCECRRTVGNARRRCHHSPLQRSICEHIDQKLCACVWARSTIPNECGFPCNKWIFHFRCFSPSLSPSTSLPIFSVGHPFHARITKMTATQMIAVATGHILRRQKLLLLLLHKLLHAKIKTYLNFDSPHLILSARARACATI